MNGCAAEDVRTGAEKEALLQKESEGKKVTGRARLVVNNCGALGISAVAGKLLFFALFVLIGRYLGPGDFGKFTFALSFIAMFAVLNDLGLNIMTVREVAKDKSLTNKYLNNLVVLKTVLSFFALVIVMGLVMVLGYPDKTIKIVFLLALATFFANVSFGIRWIFQAYLKLKYDSALSMIQNALSLGLGYLVLKLGWGIYGIGSAQIVVWMLILILAWTLISKKFTPIKFEFDFGFWKELLKSSYPFALMFVFTGLYLNLDTVLLSFYKGDEAAGLYNAANRFVLAGKMIPGIIIPALFPIMSEISKKTKEEFDQFLAKSLTLIFCLALPLSVGILFLSGKIIDLLYGAKFSGSATALQILIWGMFCMYISIVIGHGLTAKGYQKTNTAICGIGLGISLLVNFALIHKFSYLGTSIAILATEFFVMLAVIFYGYKHLQFDFRRILIPFSKVTFATLNMSIILYLVKGSNLFFCIGAAGAVYFITLFSMRGLYGYDFYKLRKLILART